MLVDPNQLTNPTATSVFCLCQHEGNLLMLLRKRGTHSSGMWGLVGGRKHADETSPEAMLRELREETGKVIDPEEVVYLRSFGMSNDGGAILLDIYKTVFNDPLVVVDPEEHAGFAWYTPFQVRNLSSMVPDNRQMFSQIWNHLWE